MHKTDVYKLVVKWSSQVVSDVSLFVIVQDKLERLRHILKSLDE